MKCKRILSMLLTLCMVMSLFAGTTVTASAADGATTLYVNGVDTAGGSPAQYATAELKLNGYTAGAALNQATITTTSSTGFKSISLDGFMDKPDGKSDTIGNFSGTKTYYVILKMPRNTGYELQENDGKPVGVTLEGATPEPLSENKDFLIFKMNSKPAAAASPSPTAWAKQTAHLTPMPRARKMTRATPSWAGSMAIANWKMRKPQLPARPTPPSGQRTARPFEPPSLI